MDAEGFAKVFLALFLTGNVLPILPVVLNVTEHFPYHERKYAALKALVIGTIAAVFFVTLGLPALGFAGMSVNDLRIAGGIILIVYATHDLLFSREQRKQHAAKNAGQAIAVPLGVPIMVGPATLAMSLVLTEVYGLVLVVLSLVLNLILNWVIIVVAQFMAHKINPSVLRISGKVMGLFLATIAVSMVRTGVMNFASQVQ